MCIIQDDRELKWAIIYEYTFLKSRWFEKTEYIVEDPKGDLRSGDVHLCVSTTVMHGISPTKVRCFPIYYKCNAIPIKTPKEIFHKIRQTCSKIL